MERAVEKTVEALQELRDAVIRLEAKVEHMDNSIRGGPLGPITDRVVKCETELAQVKVSNRLLQTQIDGIKIGALRTAERARDRVWDAVIKWGPTIIALAAAGYLATKGQIPGN